MSPAHLIALLHIHADGGRASLMVPNDLLEMGLVSVLEYNGMDTIYGTTEGGRMLVDALCAVPAPIKKWSMP